MLRFYLCGRPDRIVPAQVIGVIGRRQELLPPWCADRSPTFVLVCPQVSEPPTAVQLLYSTASLSDQAGDLGDERCVTSPLRFGSCTWAGFRVCQNLRESQEGRNIAWFAHCAK